MDIFKKLLFWTNIFLGKHSLVQIKSNTLFQKVILSAKQLLAKYKNANKFLEVYDFEKRRRVRRCLWHHSQWLDSSRGACNHSLTLIAAVPPWLWYAVKQSRQAYNTQIRMLMLLKRSGPNKKQPHHTFLREKKFGKNWVGLL